MLNEVTYPDENFGTIRKLIWPIHNYELKKFLPLSFIMFCILFNYTLLRDTKDTLIVNAAGAGVIPFLKLWCVTPGAILFVIFYAKLSNYLSKENIFYVTTISFLLFFGVFPVFIYPNLSILHPSAEWVAHAHKSFPAFSGFINIVAYWTYSVFYVLAELWGSVMVSLMFWQFANQIVRMRESKRFYGLFVVIGNIAVILSGKFMKFCSQDIKQHYTGEDVWGVSLSLLMGSVIIMGIIAIIIYRWMHTNVLTDPRYYDMAKKSTTHKTKKLGLIESFKIIASSSELWLITILMISYGITINLVEVQWKEQVRLCFSGDTGAYGGFMGDYSCWSGVFTILFGLFVGSNILRVLSWFKAAVITPIFMLLSGSLFLCFILSENIAALRKLIEFPLSVMAINPIIAATFLGAGIVMLSKTVKYTLFDPTREMVYIRLSEELKTTGKAAVDIIGGRAGKASGALAQSSLMMIFGTINVINIAPFAFGMFIVVCLLWILAVKKLSKKVGSSNNTHEKHNT